MRTRSFKKKASQALKRGQIAVLFALMITVIVLMLGAGLDIGFFYREKAKLSKALDGAAIRLANRISMTDAQRRQALQTFLRNNDPRWNTVVWSGNTATTPTGMTVSYQIEQFGPPGNQDAVRVRVTAKSKAPVFFTRLAGINDVQVASSSVAERFPGMIVLILDVSGSMRGTRWFNMVNGAKDFVNNPSFDPSRDRMAVFIYGSRAAPIYPTPDSNGNVVPVKNFRTGAISALNNLYDGSSTRPVWGFNGSTSSSEGMRIAFNAVEQALPTDAEQRRLFKVSYVFLTDGAFNTLRTFAVGRGYGWTTQANATYPHSTTVFTNTSIKPSWHGTSLLSVGNTGWTGLTNFTRPGVSGATSTGEGPFNLQTLFGGVSWSTLPGVACTIHAQTFVNPERDASGAIVGGSASFARWGKWPSGADPNSNTRMFWPHNWSNVIYDLNGSFFRDAGNNLIPDFNWRHDTNNPLPERVDYMMLRQRNFPVPNAGRNFNSGYSAEHIARIRWEMLQLRYGYLLYMPQPVFNSGMNFSAFSKSRHPNQSVANLQDPWFNFLDSAGRIYVNVYGAASHQDGSAGTSTSEGRIRGIYLEQTNSDGMTRNNTNYSFDFWNRATARLTDAYPEYHYGTPWPSIPSADRDWLANDLNWTGGRTPNATGGFTGTLDNTRDPDSALYQLHTNLWPHHGVPRYVYRPSTASWHLFHSIYDTNGRLLNIGGSLTQNRTNMDNIFLDEGNFLTEAQCWIARIQHKAAVYTIAYEVSGVEAVLRRMANETAAGARFYNTQKKGMYRAATTATIQQVFNEIASKIGVAITQ